MGFWEYFKAVVAIVAIIFAALYITKLIAKMSGGGIRSNTGIRLIGTLPLARDKSVAVVEIGNYAYVLGVGGGRVERLDKVLATELNIIKSETVHKDFTAYFKDELIARYKKSVDR